MIKRSIFVIIFLISTHAFAQAIGNQWKLSRNENDVKVWQLIKNTDVTGSLQVMEKKQETNWAKISKDTFFKNLEEKKKKTLSLIGVRDWTATNYRWTDTANGPELNISGSYRDSSDTKIEFQEIHLFRKKKTIQILLTKPADYKLEPALSKNFIDAIMLEAVGR